MAKNKGVDEFVHRHFTPVGPKNDFNKVEHAKLQLLPRRHIVHRDSRCVSHIAKTGEGFCSHAHAELQGEARRRLMAKGDLPRDCGP